MATVEELDTQLAEADKRLAKLEAERDKLLDAERAAAERRLGVAEELRDTHNDRIRLVSERDRLANQLAEEEQS